MQLYIHRKPDLLGDKTGKQVFFLDEAKKKLPSASKIIYMGWIHASHIQEYKNAAKYFSIQCACGVGLCDTGKGIGKELLSRVVNEAKEYGCGTVQITASDMGVKLYTDFGFKHKKNLCIISYSAKFVFSIFS